MRPLIAAEPNAVVHTWRSIPRMSAATVTYNTADFREGGRKSLSSRKFRPVGRVDTRSYRLSAWSRSASAGAANATAFTTEMFLQNCTLNVTRPDYSNLTSCNRDRTEILSRCPVKTIAGSNVSQRSGGWA